MTVRCSKLTKEIQFGSKKDRVIIRPITHEEMSKARNYINNSNVLVEFLGEMKKLLDKDPNSKIEETYKKQMEEIKKISDNENISLTKYNQTIIEYAVLEAYDDGKKVKNIKKYLSEIRNDCYEQILQEIYQINIPSKDKADFLVKKPD